MSGIPIYEIVEINILATAAPLAPLNFGSLLGAFTHEIGDPVRFHGPFSKLADLSAVFSAETEIMAWANAVFGVGEEKAIREVVVGRIDSLDATLTASLDAIAAAYPAFYYLNVESRVEADILEAATWTEAQSALRIYLAQTADAAVKAATAGNVALDLQTAARNRTALEWNANSAAADGDEDHHAYRDGAWASQVGRYSLDRFSPPWDFQTLSGQVPDTFTSTEITNLKNANCNLYAPIDGFNDGSGGTAIVPYMWPGLCASGRAIHAQCSIDWIKRRMQEAFVQHKANEAAVGRRVGIDLAGLTAVEQLASGVIQRGYSAGHLTRDEPTKLIVPRLNEISQADKDAGIIPFTATGKLRKSADTFKLDFTVQT